MAENRTAAKAKALADINRESTQAMEDYPAFHSAHEGYAVILEELDELWDEVRQPKIHRSNKQMRSEAIQVAAMALRFVVDICEE